MKLVIALATVAGLLTPATAALAAPTAPSTVRPTLVARWTFDAAVGTTIADTSRRRGAPALTVRAADSGAIRFLAATHGGKFAAFPLACTDDANCPRAMFEAPSVPDLNPGTHLFRWGATIRVLKSQVKGSANVMQKGVAKGSSQWKMQIGATAGRLQCVLNGVGSTVMYIARSASTVADGSWHKAICERNGTQLGVYVDGFRRGSVTIPSTLSITNTKPLRIGGPNFNTRSDMFHGYIDDVYAELG